MGSLQWINTIIGWEKKLEYEEERRANHRSEPYANYLAAPQRHREEWPSFFARLLQHRRESQPVCKLTPENRAECAIIPLWLL